jgi:molecular chaperone DnaJ
MHSPYRMIVPNTPVMVRVELEMSEVFQDTRKKVVYQRIVGCTECNSHFCEECHGSGIQVRLYQQGQFYVREQSACPRCYGKGEVRDASCGRCKGMGRYQQEHEVEIDFKVGSVFRGFILEGMGNQEAADQPPGALIIEVVPKPHADYEFGNNHHLLYKSFVDPVQAMLGGSIEVPLPEGGTTIVNLNPGCPEGHLEEIKGCGLPTSDGKRGSLYVKVVYKLPEALTSEQEAALRAYLKASATTIKKEG